MNILSAPAIFSSKRLLRGSTHLPMSSRDERLNAAEVFARLVANDKEFNKNHVEARTDYLFKKMLPLLHVLVEYKQL